MIFRRKLTIMLLTIALVSFSLNTLANWLVIRDIEEQLSGTTRLAIERRTTEHLQALVHNQALLLQRDRDFVVQALTSQAHGLKQLIKAAAQQPAADRINELFSSVRSARVGLYLWQAAIFADGTQIVQPPDSDIASVASNWQQENFTGSATVWKLLLVDGQLQIIAAQPIFDRRRRIVAVTAMAIRYERFFRDWQLGALQHLHGRIFIVKPTVNTFGTPAAIDSIVEVVMPQENQDRALLAQHDFATSSGFTTLLTHLASSAAGALRADFADSDSVWIYSGVHHADAFPLLIIPYDSVVAPARQAAEYVEDHFATALKLTALLALAVMAWVCVSAWRRARAVTEPLQQLTAAAHHLGSGDFSTRVDIRSGDEFEQLGAAFNRIGPQLRERQEIKESMAAARNIQQLILPDTTPNADNFDLDCLIHYCDETGGDYYDFIPAANNRIALCVGDVVGHGIAAALLMASCAGILKSAIANGNENLTHLLSSLNTFLENDVGDTRFMTLFCAFLDPVNCTLEWTSAGHGPVFHYSSADNSVTELAVKAVPLGILPQLDIDCTEQLQMNNGDMLLVGTDGIWESCNSSGEMFGSDRVAEFLIAHATLSAASFNTALLETVAQFRGDTRQEDDITVMTIKCCPTADVHRT